MWKPSFFNILLTVSDFRRQSLPVVSITCCANFGAPISETFCTVRITVRTSREFSYVGRSNIGLFEVVSCKLKFFIMDCNLARLILTVLSISRQDFYSFRSCTTGLRVSNGISSLVDIVFYIL